MKALRLLKKKENTKNELRQRLASMHSTRLAKYKTEYYDIWQILHIQTHTRVSSRGYTSYVTGFLRQRRRCEVMRT